MINCYFSARFLYLILNACCVLGVTIAVPEGCHDADGVHRTVGEGWKVDSGYCKCYERGNIWCVSDPVSAPPRKLHIPF